MKNIFIIIFTIIIASYSTEAQIYVSPSGNDTTGTGSISNPYRTIQKALSYAYADSTIYLRDGIYNFSSTLKLNRSGSQGKYIKLWAYPGEHPVLDFSGESYSSSSRGISISVNYCYLKGLVVRNAGDNGIYISGGNNIIENCQIYNNKDTGLQISSGGNNNYIYNCDAYDNNDPATGGQNADGIDVKLSAGPGNVIRGCRVFDNADDGYDCYQTSYQVIFDSCWAFHNGYNLWNIQNFTGNGNGFKLGGDFVPGPHVVTNCVSFDNVIKGFDQNNNTAGVTLYNCTSFRNGTYNFSFPTAPASGNGEDTLKNNISYAGGWNTSAGSGGDAKLNSACILQDNSWQNFSVSDTDFISLDTSLARVQRLADGTLPSTNFLRLNPNSSLVDAGVNVGIRYNGKAPDLGAFESGIFTAINETKNYTPVIFHLSQNYPNPFNPSTKIIFTVKEEGMTDLIVYDLLGRVVENLMHKTLAAGEYSVYFNAGNLPSGIYVYRLSEGMNSVTKKMILLK